MKWHLDLLDNREVIGWVTTYPTEPTPRTVAIRLNGAEIASIQANLYRPDLKEKNVSDGYSGFAYPLTGLDLTNGCNLEIVDKESGFLLGRNLPAPLRHSTAPSLPPPVCPELVGVDWDADLVTATVRLIVPGGDLPVLEAQHGVVRSYSFFERWSTNVFEGYERMRGVVTVRPNGDGPVRLRFGTSGKGFARQGVESIWISARRPAAFGGIDFEAMTRVAGPQVARELFESSGIAAAHRIKEIVESNTARRFWNFEAVLDWGVGCCRVAHPMRALLPRRCQLQGVDVDRFNIELAAEHFPQIAVKAIDYSPPLPFGEGHFDLIYGISVFSHLSEADQFAWLEELARVLKPGGLLLVSIHGSFAIRDLVARGRSSLIAEIVARGISDQSPDDNLGPKLSDRGYYRATYHTHEYVRRNWSRNFDIVRIFPSTNDFTQDFVLLRGKKGND